MLGIFVIGFVVGGILGSVLSLFVCDCCADEFGEYKRNYKYTYSDVSKAWHEGRDGKPPRPPAPC
jgi:hypothetical protein